jgi:hypothetical protein
MQSVGVEEIISALENMSIKIILFQHHRGNRLGK